MPATSLPATSILYDDAGSAGRTDPGVGLGRRVTWSELAGELEALDFSWTGKHTHAQSIDAPGMILLDDTQNIHGASVATPNGVALFYSPGGTFDPNDGGIACNPSQMTLYGSGVYIENLKGGGSGQYQYVACDTSTGGLFGIDPPPPGWQQTDTDAGVYDLGTGITAGPWVAFTGLVITVPAGGDTADGELVNIIANITCYNVTLNRTGFIGVSLGVNAAVPTAASTTAAIGPGFNGNVPVSISSTTHGGLVAGDTITLYARIESGDNAQFGVICDGSADEHEMTVSVPSAGGGSAWPGEAADFNWTGSHSWTQSLEIASNQFFRGPDADSGFKVVGDGRTFDWTVDNTVYLRLGSTISVNKEISLGATATAFDLRLRRNDAGILSLIGQPTTTTPAGLYIYGTTDSAGFPSNFKRLALGYNGTDAFTIAAEVAGTYAGDDVDIVLTPAGGGNVVLPGLPTTDPVVTDALWVSSGNVVLSGYVPATAQARTQRLVDIKTQAQAYLDINNPDAQDALDMLDNICTAITLMD